MKPTPMVDACQAELEQMFDGPIHQGTAASHFRELARRLELDLYYTRDMLREAVRFVPGGDLHGCEPGLRLDKWREACPANAGIERPMKPQKEA